MNLFVKLIITWLLTSKLWSNAITLCLISWTLDSFTINSWLNWCDLCIKVRILWFKWLNLRIWCLNQIVIIGNITFNLSLLSSSLIKFSLELSNWSNYNWQLLSGKLNLIRSIGWVSLNSIDFVIIVLNFRLNITELGPRTIDLAITWSEFSLERC